MGVLFLAGDGTHTSSPNACQQEIGSSAMYEVPKSKKSLKQNQFEFKLGGKVYRVPLLQYMKPSVARKFTDGMNEVDAAALMFEATEQPQLIDEFDDFEQVAAFVQAWQEASTVTVGESSASSDS